MIPYYFHGPDYIIQNGYEIFGRFGSVNHSCTETEIFHKNKISIMAADVLASYVNRTSTVMVLTTYVE